MVHNSIVGNAIKAYARIGGRPFSQGYFLQELGKNIPRDTICFLGIMTEAYHILINNQCVFIEDSIEGTHIERIPFSHHAPISKL